MANFLPGGPKIIGISNNCNVKFISNNDTTEQNPKINIVANIEALDSNMPIKYTSIDRVTAYFEHMKSIIEDEEKHFVDTLKTEYNKDFEKYVTIVGNILLSAFVDDIECEVSYIRLGGDVNSPFNNANLNINTANACGANYIEEILKRFAEYIDKNLLSIDGKPMLAVVKLNGISVAYYSSDVYGIRFYPFNTVIVPKDDPRVKNLPGISISNNNELKYNINDTNKEKGFISELFPAAHAGNENKLSDDELAEFVGMLNKWIAYTNGLNQNVANGFVNLKNIITKKATLGKANGITKAVRISNYNGDKHLDNNEIPRDGYEFLTLPSKEESSGNLLFDALTGVNFKAVYYSNDKKLSVTEADSITSYDFDNKGNKFTSDNGVFANVTNNPGAIVLNATYKTRSNQDYVIQINVTPAEKPFSFMPIKLREGQVYYNSGDAVNNAIHTSDGTNIPVFLDKYVHPADNSPSTYPITKEFFDFVNSKGYKKDLSYNSFVDNDGTHCVKVTCTLTVGNITSSFEKKYYEHLEYDNVNNTVIYNAEKIDKSDGTSIPVFLDKYVYPADNSPSTYPITKEFFDFVNSKGYKKDLSYNSFVDNDGTHGVEVTCTLTIGGITLSFKKKYYEHLEYDNANNTVIYNAQKIDKSDGTSIPVFLDKYVHPKKIDNQIYPITKEFYEFAVKNGFTLELSTKGLNKKELFDFGFGEALSGLGFSDFVDDNTKIMDMVTCKLHGLNDNFILSFMNAYFTNSEDDSDDPDELLPEISIYPYIKFKDTITNNDLLKKYNWCFYMGENSDNLDKIRISYPENNNLKDMEINNSTQYTVIKGMKQAKFRSAIDILPENIYVSCSDKDLGMVSLPKPTSIDVDLIKNIICALDFGSRNSIMATYVNGNFDYYFDNFEKKVVLDNNVSKLNSNKEIRSVSGLPHYNKNSERIEKTIDNSFVSYCFANNNYYVLDADANFYLESGRIVGELDDDILGRICALTSIDNTKELKDWGVFKDFKRELYNPDMKNQEKCVEMFIQECYFRMVLNALAKGCGDIEIRFSAPDNNILAQINGYFGSVMQDVNNYYFNNALPNVKISANCMTEADSLFELINKNNAGVVKLPYELVIDAGDSTFDISVIHPCQDGEKTATGKAMVSLDSFSIKYGGHRLILDSIKDIYGALYGNNVKIADFYPLFKYKTNARLEGQAKYANDYIFGKLFNNIHVEKGVLEADNTINLSNEDKDDAIYELIENKTGNFPFAVDSESSVVKLVKDFIEMKYKFILYCIIVNSFYSLPPNGYKDLTIFMYGGTSNVGPNMIWGDKDKTKTELKNFVQTIISAINNKYGDCTTSIKNIDIELILNPQKTDLVNGLAMVSDKGIDKGEIDKVRQKFTGSKDSRKQKDDQMYDEIYNKECGMLNVENEKVTVKNIASMKAMYEDLIKLLFGENSEIYKRINNPKFDFTEGRTLFAHIDAKLKKNNSKSNYLESTIFDFSSDDVSNLSKSLKLGLFFMKTAMGQYLKYVKNHNHND